MITAGFFFLLGLVAGAALAHRLLPRHAPSPDRAAWDAGLRDLAQRMDGHQAKIIEFERERAVAQAILQRQVEAVAGAGAAVADEARTIRAALATSSGVRGLWGEAVLKNILNTCGLNESVDYELQANLGPETRLRPDAVIHLPSGLDLVIDAKASLAAFLDGLEAHGANDTAGQTACFVRFAQVLRARARELGAKDYSGNLASSLPFVVMFVPSEGAFRAALDADPELWSFGQSLKPAAVLLASPSTLFPLISIIAQGWRQHRAGERMKDLLNEVGEVGRRLKIFLEHVQNIGKGLDAAGKAYNAAINSHRARLAPRLEHVQDLNAGWDPMPELKPVENAPQLAAAGEAES